MSRRVQEASGFEPTESSAYGAGFDEMVGVPVPPPPPDESTEESAGSPRYSFLVSRLRNRQITMEEATELFTLQRQQVRSIRARVSAIVQQAAPPPSTIAPLRPPQPPPPPGGMPSLSGEFLADGLLFLGIGAGLLAAILKRAQLATGVVSSAPASSATTPSSQPDQP